MVVAGFTQGRFCSYKTTRGSSQTVFEADTEVSRRAGEDHVAGDARAAPRNSPPQFGHGPPSPPHENLA